MFMYEIPSLLCMHIILYIYICKRMQKGFIDRQWYRYSRGSKRRYTVRVDSIDYCIESGSVVRSNSIPALANSLSGWQRKVRSILARQHRDRKNYRISALLGTSWWVGEVWSFSLAFKAVSKNMVASCCFMFLPSPSAHRLMFLLLVL